MANILVADSGSTKTEWNLVAPTGSYISFTTGGINPYYMTDSGIIDILQSTLDYVGEHIPDDIFFYGAGCNTPLKKEMVSSAFNQVYRANNIQVESDLLGAARALCQNEPGIACILGTGSNSCHYDGSKITSNVAPLGYTLGDEGSGAAIGKRLIADILKKQLPSDIIKLFFEFYEITEGEILHNVYREAFPNRYLAQFARFVSANIHVPELEALVLTSFDEFVGRNLFQYSQLQSSKIFFTGSVAFAFNKQLESTVRKYDLHLGRIVNFPIKDLTAYHLQAKKTPMMSNNELPLNEVITEKSSLYNNLEDMSTEELLTGINSEDAKVHEAVAKVIPQIRKLVDGIVERMQKGGRIFYIGAGTSGRLGVLDASEIPPTFGVSADYVIGLIAGGDTALRKSVESAEDDVDKAWEELKAHDININDTLIGIAASGTTPYVVGGLSAAREYGILTGCITCNPGSKVAEVAECPIEVVVGPEFVTGSTRLKSGTAQKMVLNMITTTTMIKLGRVKGNKMVNMQLTNKKLVLRGTRMIVEELHIASEEAKTLLLTYGSVKRAIENYKLSSDNLTISQ